MAFPQCAHVVAHTCSHMTSAMLTPFCTKINKTQAGREGRHVV